MGTRAVVVAVALATLLAACKREPTFDERYEAAQTKISQTEEEIDARLGATEAPQPEASGTAP
ncbi:hypothetical protein [Novosphingobium malaysiense]|uniref:Lipoprotein n=1 Tax=Novosphingobium malaysiense TaxID=1348853 RepID=A0A0B1ZJN9_9SPHN|nr:hypothetical protein [Novosphingobium malaysiense]KHK91330.1 hypothetical protein LK12_10680 [Novosphingobium malaysiense]